MITGNETRRLIELAFDYVSAPTEEQAHQIHSQVALLATETTTVRVWLGLIDYMQQWSRSKEHKEPMGRASALQFFSTRQAELNLLQHQEQ